MTKYSIQCLPIKFITIVFTNHAFIAWFTTTPYSISVIWIQISFDVNTIKEFFSNELVVILSKTRLNKIDKSNAYH